MRTATLWLPHRDILIPAILSCLAMAAFSGTARAQQPETHRLTGDDVAVYNLAGTVRVEPGTGDAVVVEVTRGGDDAASLRVETIRRNGGPALVVVYPEDRIVYPELGWGSRTRFPVRRDGTFGDGDVDGDRVTIAGSGRGLRAHADLRIALPAGKALAVYHGAGKVSAANVDGRILLSNRSGSIEARQIAGAAELRTGSGSVQVDGAEGSLEVRTGSGSVRLADVRATALEAHTGSGSIRGSALAAGEMELRTGSGRIEVDGVRGTRAEIRTGSGRIRVDGLEVERLEARTGSGGIRAVAVRAPELDLDTGSGSVELGLLSDVNFLRIDAGSGSVRVTAPEALGAELDIDTGSGGIDVEFPVSVLSQKRSRLIGSVGDGAGRIEINTGSGGVKLLRG